MAFHGQHQVLIGQPQQYHHHARIAERKNLRMVDLLKKKLKADWRVANALRDELVGSPCSRLARAVCLSSKG